MGSRTARAPMPESGRRRKAGGKTAMACSSAAISQYKNPAVTSRTPTPQHNATPGRKRKDPW